MDRTEGKQCRRAERAAVKKKTTTPRGHDPLHGLEKLIPPERKLHHPRNKSSPWVSAIKYIDQLTGRSTKCNFRIQRMTPSDKRTAKLLLESIIPAAYCRDDTKNNGGNMTAAWAVAYIKQLQLDRAATAGHQSSTNAAQVGSPDTGVGCPAGEVNSIDGSTSTSTNETGDDEDDPSAMAILKDKILAFKKIEIDSSDPRRVVSVTKEMIEELNKGARDIGEFGARGNGDFEKMAWAAYSLRRYFMDEVNDLSNIVNLLDLVRLAVDLAKVLKDALNDVKVLFDVDENFDVDADDPTEQRALLDNTKPSLLPQTGPSQIDGAPSSTRPEHSFAFCSSLSGYQSLSTTSSASIGSILDSVRSNHVLGIKAALTGAGYDQNTSADLQVWGSDWSANALRMT